MSRSESSLEATGELDLATSPILAAALTEARLHGNTPRLDLRNITFMDAAGVRTLAEYAAASGEGFRLEVSAASSVVQRLFLLVGTVPAIIAGADGYNGAEDRQWASRPADVSRGA